MQQLQLKKEKSGGTFARLTAFHKTELVLHVFSIHQFIGKLNPISTKTTYLLKGLFDLLFI